MSTLKLIILLLFIQNPWMVDISYVHNNKHLYFYFSYFAEIQILDCFRDMVSDICSFSFTLHFDIPV